MTSSLRRSAIAFGALLVLVLPLGCQGPNHPAAALGVNHGPTWNSVDLPGQYSDARSAVYDPARNSLWIMSRETGHFATDPMFVTLNRLNVADRSLAKTPFNQPADGYDTGSMAIDSHGAIWMGWGQTLARYDPDSQTTQSWKLPQYSGLARLYSGDGRMMALTIDSSGEIWVVASMVSGLFGFNPVTGMWDRTVNLPFVPNFFTKLGAPRAGTITINGAPLKGGAVDINSEPVFAIVTTGSDAVRMLPAHVFNYVVIGSDEIVYSDVARNIARLSLVDGQSTVVVSKAPLDGNPSPDFTTDGQGHLWFALLAYRSIGVASLDLTNGSITQFPFPYIKYPGRTPPATPSPLNMPCPGLTGHCIDSNALFDPGVQAIALDKLGNVWVVTSVPSTTIVEDHFPISPVVELQPID